MYRWFHDRLARRDRGFTLIELVVVLAIIAILVLAAIPLYMGARKKAYKAEAENALQELKTMLWGYYQQNNTFPTTAWTGPTCNSTGSADPATGFQPPKSQYWQYSYAAGSQTSITMTATGCGGPLGAGDQISLTLNSDGSTTSSSTF
jgi:prepilin-type N-terminal cleavage/methylation domain-containing protein